MNELSDKTVMVIGAGLFLPVALRLSRDFGRVIWYSEYKSSFPNPDEKDIGAGYEEIERAEHLFDHVDETDLFFFVDVGLGDLQEHLVSLGKRVWGSRKADELELYRPEFKETMERLGMPVGEYEVVEGIDELRDALEVHQDWFVKTSTVRGLTETFRSMKPELIDPKLTELETHLMGRKKDMTFIIEKPIDADAEVGYDGPVIDGRFPNTAQWGYEIKGKSYLAKFDKYLYLPKPVRFINEKLSPELEQYGYRGMFSTEIRVSKNVPYLIDPTCRCATPAGELQLEMFKNYSEVCYYGAEGEVVDPIPTARYGAQLMLQSEFFQKNRLNIEIPEKDRQWVKLYNSCFQDGIDTCIPLENHQQEIGSVLGLGVTPEQAVKDCMKHCEWATKHTLIDGVNEWALDDAIEAAKKGEKIGMKFW